MGTFKILRMDLPS